MIVIKHRRLARFDVEVIVTVVILAASVAVWLRTSGFTTVNEKKREYDIS